MILGQFLKDAFSGTHEFLTKKGFVEAFGYSLMFPNADPPGANDWSCRPTEDHPYPVVLVHGTSENAYSNWAGFAPLLKQEGYCVFAPNFGEIPGSPLPAFKALGPIEESAQQLGAYIDRVLDETGAEKVDVVGHSQGGMMPRYYIKFLGGSSKVHSLVGLAPSNHGTTVFNIGELLARVVSQIPLAGHLASSLANLACHACTQQLEGSEFLKKLNEGGDTLPGINYTVIATQYDEVITPYTNCFLTKAENVKNITLQEVCSEDFTDHIGISYDPIALRLVLNALDPSTAEEPECRRVLPVISK
jgi:triacylglycerol esterase/lipase EstA (alpha/beta hydrolase family)